MRGKGKLNVVGNHIARITPAYAGKSLYSKGGRVVFWDHPRLCGEKKHRTYIDSKVKGSPPPMRGKVIKIADFYGVSRITPAYAGKSGVLLDRGVSVRDHPRLCGEKADKQDGRWLYMGSPPPMRGKGQPNTRSSVTSGITPAYAGKSPDCPNVASDL